MSEKTTTINRNDNGAAQSVTITERDDDGSSTSRTYEAEFAWDGNVKPGGFISETTSEPKK